MLRLFDHYISRATFVRIAADTVLLFGSILTAFVWQSRGSAPALGVVIPSAFAFSVLILFFNSVLGVYRGRADGSFGGAIAKTALSIALTVPVAYGVFQLFPWPDFEEHAMGLTAVFILSAVLVYRGFAARTPTSSLWTRRILVIGTGDDALAVEQALAAQEHHGLEIVGFYPVFSDEVPKVAIERVLPKERNVVQTVEALKATEMIVAVRDQRGRGVPISQLLECRTGGVKVHSLNSFYERVSGQVRVDTLQASWLIYGEGFRQGWLRSTIKRSFDLVCSLILLLVALPFMVLTALAIKIEDGGPILYRQERVGRGGRCFKVIKFRSMRTDAERDGKPRWASSGDSRVTRVGRFIRKTRIDELPQLFNVFDGDMSMVGPRPERPFFVDQLKRDISFYDLRHSVRPGVTGWAQVRYPYGASVEDSIQKLQYDLYYVKNHTLFLDIVVLAETVRVVLTGDGAQ